MIAPMRRGAAPPPTCLRRLAALAACACAPAFGAGGHFAVDDAKILGRGECGAESWFTHSSEERVLHAGLNCRLGPFEVGGAADHSRGDGSATHWNLEAKWARDVTETFALGFDLQPGWQARARPRYDATLFAALATWTPRLDLAVHANLGRDFVRGGADLPRGGLAVEWSPATHWWLVAERYLEQRTHFARAGLRWEAGHGWSLDFSRAQRVAGPAPSNWTLGVNIDVDGD